MITYDQLMIQLYGTNVYENVNVDKYATDITGGNAGSFLDNIFSQLKPRVVIEIGAWKGKTTLYAAHLLKNLKIADPLIIAVDTWLGSAEHYNQLRNDPVWGISKYLENGRSNLYEQFLINVMCAGYSDVIVPIVNTSAVAFQILYKIGMQADFIFVDGDHREDACYDDMAMYWELLRPGGIMAGDDFSVGWYTVICAVSRFVKERGLQVNVFGDKWVILKN